MWFQAMSTKNVCLFLSGPFVFWFTWRVIVVYEKLKQLEDPYRAFLARRQPDSGICKRPKHPWPWPFIYEWILYMVQWPKIIALRRRFLNKHSKLVYAELRKGQIRVLKLSPGKPWSSIECSLHALEMDSNLQPRMPYTALSYTWGPETPTAPILCNGSVLEVTLNLHEALLYLRYMGVETIWIDAICINQNSNMEKEEQVKRMTKIYKQADSLVVWLGGPTGASKNGMLLLDYLRLHWPYLDYMGNQSIAPQVLSRIPQGHADYVGDILFRPWFRRAWIIQELICCKSRASVLCGTVCRSWEHFVEGIRVFAKGGLLTEVKDSKGHLSVVLRQLELLRTIQPGALDLLNLALLARSAEAGNARDKVYAILGLAKDTERLCYLEGNMVHHFQVSYAKSICDVYISAAKAMIASGGLYDVLAEACGLEPSNDILPTWVPDWSIQERSWDAIDVTSRSINILGPSRPKLPGHHLLSNARTPSTFSASTSDTDTIFRSPNLLIVNGMIYGQIQQLGSRYSGYSSKATVAKVVEWLKSCEELASECSGNVSTLSKQDVLWRTLIADQAGGQQPAPAEYRDHYHAFRQSLERLLQMELDGKHDPDLILDLQSKFWLFSKELGSRCRGRKLGIVRGGMLCLVPSTALVGDLIAILDSCRVPIVLRQFGMSFRVVGDCYVHGIMYGEAIHSGIIASSSRKRQSRVHMAHQKFTIK
ncbi:heterokaryon incompatibility protein domain-containing protein [Trichoderma austrokoningii]